jgi:hypothetical protein
VFGQAVDDVLQEGRLLGHRLLFPAILEVEHHLVAERAQPLGLGLRQRSGLAVPDADRPDRLPSIGHERDASVEAQAWPARDERVVLEAWVLGGVLDDHDLVRLEDRVPAERDLAIRLVQIHPDAGLDPLPVLVDERDPGHRLVRDRRGQIGQALEAVLRQRVEDVVGVEGLEASILVVR